MTNYETADETNPLVAGPGVATVFVGVAAPVDNALLRRRALDAMAGLRGGNPPMRLIVASPVAIQEGSESAVEEGEGGPIQFVEYSLPQSVATTVPWLGLGPAYRVLAELAARAGAGACAVISPDLIALDAGSIQSLTAPILDRRAELAMPVYTPSKFEGLLNSTILYPFTRALYGRRVRYPLGPDFGVSAGLLARLGAQNARGSQVNQDQTAVWPTTEAAATDNIVAQVYLDGRHGAQNDGMDLNTVLGHLAGSLFSDAEKYAVVWQRIRGSQPGLTLGTQSAALDDGVSGDTRPMLEAFFLASRNLQEVWSLVLPPVTLLELKRLVRLAPEEFRISDALWARIVYDFALAYRLRTLSRSHLLGALTPLYLGLVASYVQEVSEFDAIRAEQRVEKLAKTFEDEKPYLVSRWRWPDRFNP